MNNYKLAPFRKHSRGYTGQNKVALRQNMKFSMEDLALVRTHALIRARSEAASRNSLTVSSQAWVPSRLPSI